MKNRILLLKNYLLGKPVFPEKPIELIIESTNKCNLSCIMCPREKMKSPITDIDFKLFKKAIDETRGNLELVDFSFRGEPLLAQNIFEMIAYAKSNNLKTYLQTNATLLDDDKSQKLLKSGLDLLTISLDAQTTETYSKIRKGINFNTVIKNIETFINYKKITKNNTFVILQIIPLKENYHEIDSFLRYWKNKSQVNIARVKPFSSRAGLINNSLYINKKRIARKTSNKRCSRIWRSLTICSNGDVLPCCYDITGKYILGNLNYQRIGDIWNGKRICELRYRHSKADFNNLFPCTNCEILDIPLIEQSVIFILDSYSMHKILAFLNLIQHFFLNENSLP